MTPIQASSILDHMSFADKTQLLHDLERASEIFHRDHDLHEALIIATGGRDRHRRAEAVIGESAAMLSSEAGSRTIFYHAIERVRQS